MSKYIECIPLHSVERIAVVFGGGRSLEQCKGSADYIMNGGFYNMSTGKPVGHLKVDGTVYAQPSWSCYGITWDSGADVRMDVIPTKGGLNYISGTELLTPGKQVGEKLTYPAEQGGSRPRTAIALGGGQLILYCADSSLTPEKLRDELFAAGAESAVMLDGGGSSQCDFVGKKVVSARKVNNYIAVWLKKSGKPPEEGARSVNKKVVFDPGHGVEVKGKCSPDGTYLEHEFNLDMAVRIRTHLERHGVQVVLTRTDEHELVPDLDASRMENESLAARVAISNQADPELFVSIHSNAYGNGSNWTAPAGYCVYTAAAGGTAGRNIAAEAILTQAKKAGIAIHGSGLFHERFYVLRNTVAPAVLIEHGFHTNAAEVEQLKSDTYRDKLAEVDAKGILDYLGIAWKEPPAAETQPTGDRVCCPYCSGRLKIEKG